MTATYSGPGTYIAVCNAGDFKSHYLRLFTIPNEEQWKDTEAGWYFMNRVNFVACLEMVLPFSALVGTTLLMPVTACVCGSVGVAASVDRLDEEDENSSLYFWMHCGSCAREVDGYTLEGCFAKWRGLPVPKEEEEAKAAFRAKWEEAATKLEDDHTHLTNLDDDDEEEWNGDE